ncbi:MAG TPA: tyrosine-type recombinase/integrase [Egibacteraceae bacterium]|nr:tyrosine-type recombinase/integrase [Egibacteraceae bacterium]
MAYIEKRGRRWRVRWRDPDGDLQGRTFTREDEAKRFRARVEGDLASGGYVDPERARTTVAGFAATWRESVVDLRPSTLARLDATVNTHVLPEFGRWPLAAVGNADVRAWVAGMRAAGLSASSVRKAVFALRRILAAAVADRRLAVNTAENVPLPGEEHGEQRFLTPDEVATLVAAMPPRYRALVLLACYGGLRFGELAGLRRARVDLVRGRVTVAETLVEVSGHLPRAAQDPQRAPRRADPPQRDRCAR